MAGRLDVRQRTHLHLGHALAAAIPPTAVSRRAFVVVVTPYHADPRPKQTLADCSRRTPFPKVLKTQRAFDRTRRSSVMRKRLLAVFCLLLRGSYPYSYPYLAFGALPIS